VRQAAVKIIAKAGEPSDAKLLGDRILAITDNAEREHLARAVSEVAGRMPDVTTRCDVIIETFGKADAAAKAQLIPILAALGGDRALATIRAALAEPGDVHKAAVRALGEWKDATPVADLRAVAKAETDEAVKLLALRGFIGKIGASAMTDDEKVQAFREALEMASRPEEKVMILAGVATIARPASLELIAPCLTDEKLKNEAYLAYEKAAEALVGSAAAGAVVAAAAAGC
jgi:hypothetical protein